MSALSPKQQPSPAPNSNATASDGTDSGSIHPVTWMAIGGGLIGIIAVLAVLLGFFDRRTPSVGGQATASTRLSENSDKPLEAKGEWWKGLGTLDDEPGATQTPPAVASYTETGSKLTNTTSSAGSSKGVTQWGNDPLALPGKPLSPEDLYEQIAPSVVTIKVKDEDDNHIATGSGFFIDERKLSNVYRSVALHYDKRPNKQNAYVITNYHVMRPAVSADVVLSNGDEGTVENVLVEDEHSDLALLLVYLPSNEPAKGIPLASETPRVLTTVYAIGSPKGLSGSASEGKVSGYRELPDGEHWLQTTAPISPGSSGGPLLLPDGTLAGVTTLILKDAQNVNFAVPAAKVKEFLSSQYRPRDVAEGTSVRWAEDHAFIAMRVAISISPKPGSHPPAQYSSSEKHAAELLEKARDEIGNMFSERGNEILHLERAIDMAKQSEASLPKEFGYLVHYIIGKASFWKAYYVDVADHHSPEPIAQRRARHRASSVSQSAYSHFLIATQMNPDFAPAFDMQRIYHADLGDWLKALVAADRVVQLLPRCAKHCRIVQSATTN